MLLLACLSLPQVWEERDREFVAAGDLTMEEDCLILLIDADTKVRSTKPVCCANSSTAVALGAVEHLP